MSSKRQEPASAAATVPPELVGLGGPAASRMPPPFIRHIYIYILEAFF